MEFVLGQGNARSRLLDGRLRHPQGGLLHIGVELNQHLPGSDPGALFAKNPNPALRDRRAHEDLTTARLEQPVETHRGKVEVRRATRRWRPGRLPERPKSVVAGRAGRNEKQERQQRRAKPHAGELPRST
jgi:hypothetical protein